MAAAACGAPGGGLQGMHTQGMHLLPAAAGLCLQVCCWRHWAAAAAAAGAGCGGSGVGATTPASSAWLCVQPELHPLQGAICGHLHMQAATLQHKAGET